MPKSAPITLVELLKSSGNDLSDDDLATLADWANARKYRTSSPSWKRAYALIREGSDLLLRRRAKHSHDAVEREYSVAPPTSMSSPVPASAPPHDVQGE